MKHQRSQQYPLNQSYLKGWQVAMQNVDRMIREQPVVKKRPAEVH